MWVEVNSLQASGSTKIFVYYGNGEADSESDGDATFPFFENFDENGIDDWVASTGNVDHDDETGQQQQTVSTTHYVSSPNSAQLYTYASCFSGPFNGVQSIITASPNLAEGDYKVEFDVRSQITGFRFSTSGAMRSRVKINGTEEYADELNCNGMNCTALGDWTHESFELLDSTVDSLALFGDSYDCTNGNVFYDNVFVRNYASDEPEVVAIGGQDREDGTSTVHNSSSVSHSKDCSSTIPAGTPDLFQIDTTDTQATIYFTPLMDTDEYFVSFSTQEIAEEHGALIKLGREGVQNYTVGYLSPGTRYYFKVRGHKGCMPGSWSHVRAATTTGGLQSIEVSDINENEKALGASSNVAEPTPTKKPTQKKSVPMSKKIDASEEQSQQSILQRITEFVNGLWD